MSENSKFLTELEVKWLKGATFELTEDLHYYSATYRGVFVVPAGFTTDFASIPRFAQSIFPKSGQYNRAAVVHDAGYTGNLRTLTGQRVHLIKPLTDKLFYEAMRADGVGRLAAKLMYLAVKIGGDAD